MTAIYPFSISPFTIPPDDEITPVAPEVSPVTVSLAWKGILESLSALYLSVDVDGTFLTTALAPDVPPIIVSPSTNVPVVTAWNISSLFVTLCFKY